MNRLYELKPVRIFLLFILVDTICIGMGMGVPIFCILFGFIAGWFLVRSITTKEREVHQVFHKVLKYALVGAGFTFLAMLMLWGPFARYLLDPGKDLAQTGIPMILFEPRASFIGWIVLMVVISPFLQLLASIFSAYLTLLEWMKNAIRDQKAV